MTMNNRTIKNELHLFAGAGGGILGGMLVGHRPICAVEIEPSARRILFARQRDGILPPFPIWDDIRTFEGRHWRGITDIVCGGFPCQDISTAGGPNRKGINGERSGLWSEMFRIICEIRPPQVFVENSPALRWRGLGTVLGNLAEVGYHAAWGVFSAADVGARHCRERIWILANRGDSNQNAASPKPKVSWRQSQEPLRVMQRRWWSAKTRMGRKSDGIAGWMDRLAAIGNAQVPAVAAMAFEKLSAQLRLNTTTTA